MRPFVVLCLLLVWLPSTGVVAVSLIGRTKRRLLGEHPEFSRYPNLGFLLFSQSDVPFMPWYGVREPDIATFRKYYRRLRVEMWLASLGLGLVFIFVSLIAIGLTPA